MNNITFAGETESGKKLRNAGYCLIVSSKPFGINCNEKTLRFKTDEIAVIPPLTDYTPIGDGTINLVTLEKAFFPTKVITALIDDENGGMHAAINEAITYFENDGLCAKMVLTALGDLLAAFVSAFSGDITLSPVVALVKRDIENNLSNSLYALDAYIKSLPLNYDYVRKLFKKETGVTPHGYLTDSRMKIAANLLAGGVANNYTNYSVSQVAEVCGFAEPLYFSRVFKKYYGVSPSDYAKKL